MITRLVLVIGVVLVLGVVVAIAVGSPDVRNVCLIAIVLIVLVGGGNLLSGTPHRPPPKFHIPDREAPGSVADPNAPTEGPTT